jgi:2-polyprenyl-6-methoxyphenol hydroxylase-like FAD-dependent oxidoreductase
VRQALGIGFPGEAFPMGFMLGDVHIDWPLPRGMALRALRLVEGWAPYMFIAIPLPEPGRYRVSTLAPPNAGAAGGTDHGIQAELGGPDLDQLQRVADDLVPERPRLSDLRWLSMFRISMRLAEHYRQGRVFIAGDAAHIHPPTGGQGMNTGIQDAYNLAWKLALVLNGEAPEALLDSYEAERRPVGAEVVRRTRAASEGYGRKAVNRIGWQTRRSGSPIAARPGSCKMGRIVLRRHRLPATALLMRGIAAQQYRLPAAPVRRTARHRACPHSPHAGARISPHGGRVRAVCAQRRPQARRRSASGCRCRGRDRTRRAARPCRLS